MIEFMLGVAQTVLGGLVNDFITKRRTSAQSKEIESAVRAVVQERRALSPDELEEVVKQVLREIQAIVELDPDLQWRFKALRLTRQVDSDVPGMREQIVSERLDRLRFIIEHRRRVAITQQHGQAGRGQQERAHGNEQGLLPGWTAVTPDSSGSGASKSLEELRRRIRHRQGGRDDFVGEDG